MKARLLVQLSGAEFAFDLRGESVRVGAASTNGLVLRDPGVGREHFEVRRQGSVWRLVDLESASGTRVNGLYVNRQDLRNGDVISVGEARLTFLVDDAPEPAPIHGGAPAPIPAPIPAPVPAPVPWSPPAAAPAPVPCRPPGGAPAPVPAPAWTAPPAPAVPPPLPYAPSRPHQSAPPPPSYRARAPRGGGGTAGAAVGMLLIVGLLVLGVALAWDKLVPPDPVDPNPALLSRMKALAAEEKLEEAVRAAEEADPHFPPSEKPIRTLAWELRKRLRERAEVAAEQEAEEYYQQSIRAFREGNPDDHANIALRCDEFIRRWPDHARVPEASFARLRATGEPSPSLAVKGTFVSWAELTRAAEAEASRLIADDRFGDAFAVYDRFTRAMPRTVLPEYQDKFMEEVTRVRAAITKKATEAFERLEEKAMYMEDKGQWDEVEDLYRRARDGYGVPDVRIRCDAELERLRERKMR